MRAGMHEMHALRRGKKQKSPEPFGSRDESMIRGTTLLISPVGDPFGLQ